MYTISEIRRSARLRGLAPEFDGLHFERRTRRSPNSSSNFDFIDEHLPLEVIVKQPKQSLFSKFLARFGFYSESEIQRRQSLRLQGKKTCLKKKGLVHTTVIPLLTRFLWQPKNRVRRNSRYASLYYTV